MGGGEERLGGGWGWRRLGWRAVGRWLTAGNSGVVHGIAARDSKPRHDSAAARHAVPHTQAKLARMPLPALLAFFRCLRQLEVQVSLKPGMHRGTMLPT